MSKSPSRAPNHWYYQIRADEKKRREQKKKEQMSTPEEIEKRKKVDYDRAIEIKNRWSKGDTIE